MNGPLPTARVLSALIKGRRWARRPLAHLNNRQIEVACKQGCALSKGYYREAQELRDRTEVGGLYRVDLAAPNWEPRFNWNNLLK